MAETKNFLPKDLVLLEAWQMARNLAAAKIIADLEGDNYFDGQKVKQKNLQARVLKVKVDDRRRRGEENPITALPVVAVAGEGVIPQQIENIGLIRIREWGFEWFGDVIRVSIEKMSYTGFETPIPVFDKEQDVVIGWRATVQGSSKEAALLTNPEMILKAGEEGNRDFAVNLFGAYFYSMGEGFLRADTFRCCLPLKHLSLFPKANNHWLITNEQIDAAIKQAGIH